MAAVIATEEARRLGIDVRVASAGTAAVTGHPAVENAREAIEEIGLTLDSHRAQMMTRELVADAALVVAVTARHRDDLRHVFPNDREKIVSFDDLTGLGDLNDPYGGEPDEFRRTAALLIRGMPNIIACTVNVQP